jgi:hypothetical protein
MRVRWSDHRDVESGLDGVDQHDGCVVAGETAQCVPVELRGRQREAVDVSYEVDGLACSSPGTVVEHNIALVVAPAAARGDRLAGASHGTPAR